MKKPRKLHVYSRRTGIWITTILWACISVLTPATVRAAEDCNEAMLRNRGVAIINCTGDCGSSAQPATGSSANIDVNYTDASRGNRAVGATAYLPDGGGKYPLVMFSPGRDQNSKADGMYARYLKAIASRGFVVVGANYIDNHSAAAQANEVVDIKFLITKVQEDSQIKGKILSSAGIGMVGHSDGGVVALTIGYGAGGTGTRDTRVTAVISEDGAIGGPVQAGPPLLLTHGTSDTINPISSSNNAFAVIQAPYKSFAKFTGADHDHYITEAGKWQPAVDDMTTSFLKRALSKDGSDATDLGKLAAKYTPSIVTLDQQGTNTPQGAADEGSSSGSSTSSGGGSGVIERYMRAVASHESGGNPTANSGNGATGKYQNTPAGWRFLQGFYPGASTYSAAYLAPESVQDAAEYLSVVGQLKKYNGDLTKVIIDQYYPAANDDLETWWNKVPGSGNTQTIGSFVTDIISRINSGEGSNIPLKYSEAPGFQDALNAQGGNPSSVTTSKGGVITDSSTGTVVSGDLCCDTSGGGSVAPSGSTAAAGLSAQNVAFLEQYHAIAEKLSIDYGIPWEAVMAQGIIESGSGTSEYATQRNNFFGIGAFDSNPDNAFNFPTPEAGWKGYFDNIVKTQTYRAHGVFREPTITDPIAYLTAIKAAGYATDPNYISKISAVIKSIQDLSTQKGWDSSAKLAEKNPEMLTNAAANAAGGSPSSPDVTTGPSKNCNNSGGSSGVNGGSIVDVAREMGSWGATYQACYIYGGGHAMSKDQLDEAINHHFTGSYGVDCSGFVRAVIYKATGNDIGGLATQGLCSSSSFDRIPKNQARPGDLLINCAEHVAIISSVNGDGTFESIGANNTGCGEGHGPSSPASWFQGGESFVLRYKGGATQ